MEKRAKFSWRARARSFIYAGRGVRVLLTEEHNARIHMVAAVVAILLGLLLGISAGEWVAICICIGAVLMAEAFNTAIEAVCDLVSRERHPLIARAKDVAAGGVLVMAVAALITGIIIFLPKIIPLL